jgi:hypothetical protein
MCSRYKLWGDCLPPQWVPRNTNLWSCVEMSSPILPWHVYYDVGNFSWDLSTPQVEIMAKQKGISTSNQKSPNLRQDLFGWVLSWKFVHFDAQRATT